MKHKLESVRIRLAERSIRITRQVMRECNRLSERNIERLNNLTINSFAVKSYVDEDAQERALEHIEKILSEREKWVNRAYERLMK